MAASISARNPRTTDAAKARLDAACEKLAGLRAELLQLAQDDVHRYCALLSGVYEQKGAEKQAKVALWTHKCAETPMLVVKNAVAALNIIARPDGAAALVSSFTRSVVSRKIIAEIWVTFFQNLSDNLADRRATGWLGWSCCAGRWRRP